MITFSTDNRMSNNQSAFHLVFFKVDGVFLRYTELSAEQQVEANKIYPVTFEARQKQLHRSNEAVEQMRAPDVCHECGESETIDPNNDGVPTCVHCGTRR